MDHPALPPFLTDENIPDPAGDFLQGAGHAVYRLRDVAARGTADPIVALIADELGAILVTSDRDFRGIASRLHRSEISIRRLRKLHRVLMLCSAPTIERRLHELLPAIEFEFIQYQGRQDKRMYLEMGDSYWRSQR